MHFLYREVGPSISPQLILESDRALRLTEARASAFLPYLRPGNVEVTQAQHAELSACGVDSPVWGVTVSLPCGLITRYVGENLGGREVVDYGSEEGKRTWLLSVFVQPNCQTVHYELGGGPSSAVVFTRTAGPLRGWCCSRIVEGLD